MSMKYEKGEFLTIPNKSALRGLNPNLQVLFFWLCEHADDDNKSFPSRQTLAVECGMSVRTLDRGIQQLIELGLLKKSVRFNNGEQTTNLYEVIIVSKRGATKLHTPSDKSALGSDKNDTQNSTHLTLIDTKVSMEAKASRDFGSLEINGILDFWAVTLHKPIQRNVKRNRLAVYTLLKSVGSDRLSELVQTVARSKTDKYAPVITDFVSLEYKLDALESWEARSNQAVTVSYPNVGALLHPDKYGRA